VLVSNDESRIARALVLVSRTLVLVANDERGHRAHVGVGIER
jgi:hypothetical protein